MYEKKRNLRAISFSNFWCIFVILARNFLEGAIIGLVPKMLERSPVNFNSRRISDLGKTVI